MRVMGPLGQLWKALDDAHKAGEPSAVKTQRSAGPCGVAPGSVLQWTGDSEHPAHQEILSSLVKHSEAEKLLKKYDSECPTAVNLLGKKFEKRIEKHTQGKRGPLECILALKKARKSKKHPFRTGPQGYSNGLQGARFHTHGGQKQGNDHLGYGSNYNSGYN